MQHLAQAIGEAVLLGIIAVGCPFTVFYLIELNIRFWRKGLGFRIFQAMKFDEL